MYTTRNQRSNSSISHPLGDEGARFRARAINAGREKQVPKESHSARRRPHNIFFGCTAFVH